MLTFLAGMAMGSLMTSYTPESIRKRVGGFRDKVKTRVCNYLGR